MKLTKSEHPKPTTRKLLKNSHILLFINGFLLATLLYFYMEDTYEKQVFTVLANYVKEKSAIPKNTNDLIFESMHLTHYLAVSRDTVFSNKEISSLKSSFIRPVTYDLMTTNGACGSYSYILSRILNELNINNRIAQMEVHGDYGKHMVVEAKTEKGWIVLDPSYDLYFKKPDGNAASFADVKSNWDLYKQQIPVGYDATYDYEGVRYTNWNKVPVLMPLLHQVLYFTIGKQRTDVISLRTLTLRKYHILFQTTLALYILIIIIMVRKNISSGHKTVSGRLHVLFSGRRRHVLKAI